MATARALVTLIHQSVMYFRGDLFEYEGDLKGLENEGMEWVNKKTDKAFEKSKAAELADLQAAANEAAAHYADVKGQLAADPSRGDLIQQVLDAETKAQETAALVAAASPTPAIEAPVATDPPASEAPVATDPPASEAPVATDPPASDLV